MIYLDNAATSWPKPPEVYSSVMKTMKKRGGNPGRGSHRMASLAAEELYSLREAAGEMFSCREENVIFTYNATHALNIALKGLATEGCHILYSDLEHNSVRRPVEMLCRTMGCPSKVH